MSSMFDSEVYKKRRRSDFLSPNIIQFMKAMTQNVQTHEHSQKLPHDDESPAITLTMSSRPSVSTRLWYELKWVDIDGNNYNVQAQELDLLGWRALQMHENILKDVKRNHYGAEKNLVGWLHPDGTHCVKCGARNYKNERGDEWCSNIHCPY